MRLSIGTVNDKPSNKNDTSCTEIHPWKHISRCDTQKKIPYVFGSARRSPLKAKEREMLPPLLRTSHYVTGFDSRAQLLMQVKFRARKKKRQATVQQEKMESYTTNRYESTERLKSDKTQAVKDDTHFIDMLTMCRFENAATSASKEIATCIHRNDRTRPPTAQRIAKKLQTQATSVDAALNHNKETLAAPPTAFLL